MTDKEEIIKLRLALVEKDRCLIEHQTTIQLLWLSIRGALNIIEYSHEGWNLKTGHFNNCYIRGIESQDCPTCGRWIRVRQALHLKNALALFPLDGGLKEAATITTPL